MVACLGMAGCKTFGKKSKEQGNTPAQQPADMARPGSSALPGSASIGQTGTTDLKGVLAGRVVDSYDHPPPPTYIQILQVGNNSESKGAPIEKEVPVDSQGYFTILGPQPGQHYQLIARTREGEHRLAGSVFATPPNPRLLIRMSEDFATANTPPDPTAPEFSKQKSQLRGGKRSKDSTEQSPSSTEQRDSNQETPKTSNAIPSQRPADLGRPIKAVDQDVNTSSAPATTPLLPRNSVRPQDVASDAGRLTLAAPLANIPGNRGNTTPEATAVTPTMTSLTPRVPSCVLTGRQLDNFALNDLNGQPWEYRSHRGRIVLLDFWATYCLPCRQAIPSLKILQDRYAASGLEVVGIAYEDGTLPEQIRKVQNVRDNLGINYRLLLGGDLLTCPVKTQFAITKFPTLVLVDENSRIIKRYEGLDAYQIQELEMVIKQQLRVR
jgi:thiol-disulfide isomerase/thioredoxin